MSKKDIENKILAILKESNELESNSIKEKLGLTYDTTMKYLKRMTDSGMIIREAKGKPWNYYYKLS